MKRTLCLLLLASAAPLGAQVTVNPNGNVTPQPLCIAQTDGTCLPVTATTPLPTSATGSAGGGNTVDATGSGSLALATANATYIIPLSGGRNAVGLTITGLTGSGSTITVERSNNGGTTWTAANTTESSATASLSSTITADGQARVGVAGATNIRLRVSTTGTGTATIAYNATTAAGPVFLTSTLPSYSTPDGRIIGGVDNRFVNGTAISVGSGATDNGTQRVSLATDGNQATAANQTNGNQIATPKGAQTALADGFSLTNTFPVDSLGRILTQIAYGYVYNPVTNSMYMARGDAVGTYMSPQPSATPSAGITPTTVQGATSNVLKNAPGNVYSVNVVNSTTPGFLVIYNATAAPAGGTAISAANGLYCMQVAASVSFRDTFQTPIYANTGATLLMSTSCTTYTPIGTAPITLTGQAK